MFLHPTNSDQDSRTIYQLGNDTSSTNQLWIQKLRFKNQNPHSGHFLAQSESTHPGPQLWLWGNVWYSRAALAFCDIIVI